MRLRLGIDKKVLGLEYQEPSHRRLTLHRRSVYQTLEGMGLVGRQLELRLLMTPLERRDGFYADAAAGVDGSRSHNVLWSLRYRHGPLGLGGWGLLERHRIEHTYLPVWAGFSSLWLDTGRVRAVTELFSGIDPRASEFEREFGDGHAVTFYGPRGELALSVPLKSTWRAEPLVQGSLLAFDAERPSRGHRAQLLVGLNPREGPLVVRSNAEFVTHQSSVTRAATTRALHRTSYHASIAYSF